MSSPLFVYICTKTTADFIVPVSAASQPDFNRKVHNAFQGLVGGVLRVGDLTFRPIEAPIANHLLCDGSDITRAQYPQLVDLLAGTSATEATLPDYTGSVEATAPTTPETTTDGGTVSGGGTVDTSNPTGGSTGGNVPSGGRPIRQGGVLEN